MVLRCLPSAEGAGPLVAVAAIHAQERQQQLFENVSMCLAGFRNQVLRRSTFLAWAHFSHRDRAANDIEIQISEITELRLLQSMQWEELARQQERLLLKELVQQQEKIRKAEKRCAAAEEELSRQQEKAEGKAEGKAEAEKVEPEPAKAEGKAEGKAEAECKIWCERSRRWRDTKTGRYCRGP